MFSFIVETGEGLTNSTSYVSLAEADAYFAVHPYYADNWSDLGIPDRERLLMSATFQLDLFITWEGTLVNPNQALGWPRDGVTDLEGRPVPNNIVPKQVQIATCEMAIYASKGDPYAPSSTAGIDRLKIDVIELEFSGSNGQNGGSTSSGTLPPRALLALMGFGEFTYGSNIRKVLVG